MGIKNHIVIHSTLYLLSVLLWCQSLYAQSYITDIQKISVEDGLSSRFVNTIHKDSQGFIWIGTNYGLNRYDGYEFKHYTSENSPLRSNTIKDLYEDNAQRLWIIHGNLYDRYELNAIDILDLQTGEIQSFEDVFRGRIPFNIKNITYLYSDAKKDLWLSTSDGAVYQYFNERFERMFSTHKEGVIKIFYADDRFLWLYRKEVLLQVNPRGDIMKTLQFKDTLKNVGVDKNNTLWVACPRKKQLLGFSGENAVQQTISLQPLKLPESSYRLSYLRLFYMNPANDLIWWHQIEDTNLFLVLHPRDGIVLNLQDKIKDQLTYGRPQITDIYFETAERTWVATEDGIFIITLKKNKFKKLLFNKSKKYSTRGIVADKSGTIYVNSYLGRTTIYPYKDTVIYRDEEIRKYRLGAARDRYGNLWFGGEQESIERYNPSKQERQYYVYSDTSQIRSSQWAIIRDKKDRVWIGTSSGLYYLEPEKNLYRKFSQYNTFPQLGKSTIYHLYEDEKGIWLGTSSGMYRLEPGKGITRRYAVEENAPFHIPYNYILHFHRDVSGIFWLATKGGGLIRLNPGDGSYQQFTTADGLSNNIINAVYEDDYGKLWLPSNYGLMQFDKKNFRINTYLNGDGITHEEFNIASHYRSDEGLLYFGGLSGVTVFNPADFTEENLVPAPLHITHCQVLNGKTGVLTDKTAIVSESAELVLSPSDKSLVVEFALLNYENSRQNSYAYKIEEPDKDWTTIGANSLRINALPYGRYVLRIKGKSIKGQSSANELSIPILVNAPFYLETRFIISCILTLALLVYGIFRWRLQNLRQAKIRLQETVKQRTAEIIQQKDKIEQQAEKLLELDSAKSRFFANISHELRTPLTLILGHLQSALKGRYGTIGKQLQANLEVSRNNGSRLLNMIEEILDLSKMESGKVDLQNKPVKLYALTDRLCDTFRSYLKGKHIRFSRHIAIPSDCILLLDEKKFEKIVINLLSNAAKFTGAGGSISLRVEKVNNSENDENWIQLTVRDSGKGIHPHDLPHIFDRFYQGGDKDTPMEGGSGIGLALSKELAELMGGSLSAESRLGEGSVFTFTFPKKEVDLLPEETVMAETESLIVPNSGLKKPRKNKEPGHGTKTPLVLVVEDHPQMRNYIRQQIETDYRVLEAGDGMEAWEALQKERPDLILSDVMMPRMDGFQLLSTLRADPATEDIPVIMLTARAAREDRLHALTIGVDDYLIKPFDEEELTARIRYSLRNRLKRQQWTARLPEAEKETLTAERQFLNRAEEVVSKAISNHAYAVVDMAEDLNLSRRQLFRKIKSATGLSPLQFIHEIRLQKARNLMENKEKETVAEVMYLVGFQRSGHFAQTYFKRFGKLPSSYFE